MQHFWCCNLSKCCRSIHFFQWNESENVALPTITFWHSVRWISRALNGHCLKFWALNRALNAEKWGTLKHYIQILRALSYQPYSFVVGGLRGSTATSGSCIDLATPMGCSKYEPYTFRRFSFEVHRRDYSLKSFLKLPNNVLHLPCTPTQARMTKGFLSTQVFPLFLPASKPSYRDRKRRSAGHSFRLLTQR